MKTKIILRNFLRALIRSIGISFLFLGLLNFLALFTFNGSYVNFIKLLFNLLNTIFLFITGYGFFKLKRWSFWGILSLLILSAVIYFYNLHFNDLFLGVSNFNKIVTYTVTLLIFYFFKKTITEKENDQTNNLLISNNSIISGSRIEVYFTVVILIYFVVFYIYKGSRYEKTSLYQLNSYTPVFTATPTPVFVDTDLNDTETYHYDNTTIDNWEIVDKSQTPPFSTGLILSSRYLYQSNFHYAPNLIRWKSYLIGLNIKTFVDKIPESTMNNKPTESTHLYNKIDSIRVFNLDSREIFDIPLEKPIIVSSWGDVVSQLFENKYYFGASSNEGFGLFDYKLDLPPSKTSKIIKLDNSVGNKIEKIGNTYLSSACYEGCSYYLFNPVSSTTTKLTRMTNASYSYDEQRKEKFIGIDSQGRMIIEVRDVGLSETSMIAIVPLTNENLTIPLLKKDDLPTKIIDFSMVKGIDKILMLGETKTYIYDINQSNFIEVQIDQKFKDWRSVYRKTNKAICLFANDTTGAVKNEETISAIDLTTNTYLINPPIDCSLGYKAKTVEETFNELNLPDNFELKHTPLEFQTYWRYQ